MAERFSQRLRRAAEAVWEAQHQHPFVRGIGDGSLDVDKFAFWVRQDYLFLLEYESDRAGTFEPLRFVPKSKGVVLGLISSKLPGLEPQELLLRRIDAASRYVPLESLALSPQCGFGSDVSGNLISEADQKRKLERVVELARRVWN